MQFYESDFLVKKIGFISFSIYNKKKQRKRRIVWLTVWVDPVLSWITQLKSGYNWHLVPHIIPNANRMEAQNIVRLFESGRTFFLKKLNSLSLLSIWDSCDIIFFAAPVLVLLWHSLGDSTKFTQIQFLSKGQFSYGKNVQKSISELSNAVQIPTQIWQGSDTLRRINKFLIFSSHNIILTA